MLQLLIKIKLRDLARNFCTAVCCLASQRSIRTQTWSPEHSTTRRQEDYRKTGRLQENRNTNLNVGDSSIPANVTLNHSDLEAQMTNKAVYSSIHQTKPQSCLQQSLSPSVAQ